MGGYCKLMKQRRVFGSVLRGDSQLIEAYERIHIGLGDAIMLRPAIIGNIKRYPERRHILHIHSSAACILSDIDKLEIVPIVHPDGVLGVRKQVQIRYRISANYIDTYKNISNIYRLSTPCADYESANSPFKNIGKEKLSISVLRNDNYLSRGFPKLSIYKKSIGYAVPTGSVIKKTRQDIFCEVVGVPFSLDNYNVRFSDRENEIADSFARIYPNAVGIHLKSSTPQRDYDFITALVEYAATQTETVVVIDRGWTYEGRKNNVVSLEQGLRDKWAIISRFKMLIGPDSFGVHASGSLGIPTYGIFGPTDPKCRLTNYKNAVWSPKWRLPILRRGFKRGCGRQYCWYKSCKSKGCLNARSPKFYWNDAIKQLGGTG